ncbi:hypothetical protein SAMN02745168_2473 [Papillibacter cinnamivorans DSM 12816]|uniref:Uncharacterized protein n=1 Tax=Papillibacter cinnamivorans DSM 12816 TaxID=1122930 RepID=A0A1W2BZL0_9FIRM|nr:hypothetical protein SAMN02745168_2473 [Papillibacter cinnamivorans DSM 12816]
MPKADCTPFPMISPAGLYSGLSALPIPSAAAPLALPGVIHPAKAPASAASGYGVEGSGSDGAEDIGVEGLGGEGFYLVVL